METVRFLTMWVTRRLSESKSRQRAYGNQVTLWPPTVLALAGPNRSHARGRMETSSPGPIRHNAAVRIEVTPEGVWKHGVGRHQQLRVELGPNRSHARGRMETLRGVDGRRPSWSSECEVTPEGVWKPHHGLGASTSSCPNRSHARGRMETAPRVQHPPRLHGPNRSHARGRIETRSWCP